MRSPNPVVRPCATQDLAAISAIYGHHVTHGSGSFEIDPPSQTDMTARFEAIQHQGLPWLVAERDAQVLGFAYAGPFRPRAGFRFLVEDSVYVHPEASGQGLGIALLAELIRLCTALGKRQMLAVIGDSGNTGSWALHRRLGFEQVGILRGSGRKHGRWLDTVLMQRSLGNGLHSDPVDIKVASDAGFSAPQPR
jgi:phosphinothricin acetyltransferase